MSTPKKRGLVFHEPVPLWHKRAYCRLYDPELWFAEGTGKAAAYKDLAFAKSVCAACPVRDACLDDAMRREGNAAVEGRHGIRAGLTPGERYNRRPNALRASLAA